MKTATTRWLVLSALGLFLFILFFERRAVDTEQQAERLKRVLPDFVPGEVTAVDILGGSNLVLRLERTNDQWRFRAPMAYPAQAGGVERLLKELAELRQQSYLTAQEVLAQTNSAAAFGLAPPTATVVIQRGLQRSELRFGARTLLGREIYLEIVGRAGLCAIDAGVLKLLPASPNAWRDPALVDLTGLEFDRFEVRPGTNGFEVIRQPTNRLWQMTKPLLTRANNARLEFLLHQLAEARVSQFVTDDPHADLEPFGLLPPERELVLGQGTNDLLRLQLGKSPPENTNQVFVRRLSHTNVVLVSRAAVEPWLASFREFCDRRLMVFQPDLITRLEARADEPFAVERQTNGAWRIVEPFAAPADPVLVTEFLANLAELEFLEFEKEVVTDFTAYGLAPPRRQYLLQTTVTNTVPAPTNLTVAQIDLGHPTGHKRFARRSLENSVVTTLEPARLARAAYQLRHRQIWSFSTNQILSLTVQQEGYTRKWVRTGPVQWAPVDGAQTVVNPWTFEEAAYRLGHLRAETWVARGEDQLARYGIPAIDHRVTLELQPAASPGTLSVRFGRKAPSGRPYAAVQLDGQPGPVIFECPLSIYELVQSELTALPPVPAPPPR